MTREEYENELISIAILFDNAKEKFKENPQFKVFIQPLALTAKLLDKRADFPKDFDFENEKAAMLIKLNYNLNQEQSLAKSKKLVANMLVILRIFAYLL